MSSAQLRKQLEDTIDEQFDKIDSELRQWTTVVKQLQTKMNADRQSIRQEFEAADMLLKAMQIS